MNSNNIKAYCNNSNIKWVDQLTSAHFFWNETKIKASLLAGAQCDVYTPHLDYDCQALILWALRDPKSAIVEILALATNPKFSNQGVMKEFFKLWLLNQKINEVKEIWLEVHKNNTPAIELYTKFGFYLVGERKSYYSDGGSALLMTYKFDP